MGDSLVSPFERTLGGDSGEDLCGIEDVLLRKIENWCFGVLSPV